MTTVVSDFFVKQASALFRMNGILLVILATFGLSFAQRVSVNYGVEFNEVNGQCGGTDRATITGMVPLYNSIQSVMEAAVMIDSTYRFQLEYSPTFSGYIVSELMGVSNTDRCRWMVYISAPGFDENLVNGAVDRFHVANNYTVILRYEMGVATITILYSIQYPDRMCSISSDIPPVSVTTQGTTALDIMESAALTLGERYQFSIVYESSSSNYVVQRLNGNERTTQCMWMAFYAESSGGIEVRIHGSVANFHIPIYRGELILRFREQTLPATTSMTDGVATTTGAAQGQHGVSAVLMVVPVIMFIFSLTF